MFVTTCKEGALLWYLVNRDEKDAEYPSTGRISSVFAPNVNGTVAKNLAADSSEKGIINISTIRRKESEYAK